MDVDLFQYYGTDWLDAAATMLGIYLLGNRNKLGFLCNGIGACGGVALAVIIASLPVLILNIVLIILNIIGYVKWKNSQN